MTVRSDDRVHCFAKEDVLRLFARAMGPVLLLLRSAEQSAGIMGVNKAV